MKQVDHLIAESVAGKDDRLSAIKRVSLIMGSQCNVRCAMCFLSHYGLRGDMPPEIYLNHLLPLYPRLQYVKIDGGEVTAMPQCKEAIGFFSRYPHIEFEFSTNGVFVDEFWMDVFCNRTNLVNFSINAATAETYGRIVKEGDFTRVRKNVQTVIKEKRGGKPLVSISAVLLRHNVSELTELIRLGHEWGADRVKFSVDPILSFQGVDRDKVRDELLKARELVARTGMNVRGLHVIARCLGSPWNKGLSAWGQQACSLPSSELIVDQSGDVRVCCLSWKIIGNIYKQSVREIVESPQRRRFQERITAGDYSWCPENCWENPLSKKTVSLDKYFYLWHKNPRELVRGALKRLNGSRMVK